MLECFYPVFKRSRLCFKTSFCCKFAETNKVWSKLGPKPISQQYTVDSETEISQKVDCVKNWQGCVFAFVHLACVFSCAAPSRTKLMFEYIIYQRFRLYQPQLNSRKLTWGFPLNKEKFNFTNQNIKEWIITLVAHQSHFITRLPNWKVIWTHYGNSAEDIMDITICRMFCFMLIGNKRRQCFKANKLHSILKLFPP